MSTILFIACQILMAYSCYHWGFTDGKRKATEDNDDEHNP